jgi:hypothetical protein
MLNNNEYIKKGRVLIFISIFFCKKGESEFLTQKNFTKRKKKNPEKA